MRTRAILIAGVAAATLTAIVGGQGRGNANDWPTAFGDAQHSSWMRSDGSISVETMSRPGFALQWKTALEMAPRAGGSLTSGIVTPSVTLFTPISSVGGPDNRLSAIDNDTGNVFWARRFEGVVPAATAGCPGVISGAPTRVVSLAIPSTVPARGGAGRGNRSYSSAVGEPGEGVPLPAVGARGGGGDRVGGAGAAAGAAPAPQGGRGTQPATPQPPAAQPARGTIAAATPASPFPTNPAAQGSGGIWAPSATLYAVSADGMFRRIGLASGKDLQRPVRLVPAGSTFSDLIAVGDMAYTSTAGACGGAAKGIWGINLSGDPNTVVSWKTNGGDPIGSVALSPSGTIYATIGPGTPTAGGQANAVVALDPKTLALKDWFTQADTSFAAAPIIFQEGGRTVVVVTTTDNRVLLLDGDSLGGANHSQPLFASDRLISGRGTFARQAPALWQETSGALTTTTGNSTSDGARWLLQPISGSFAATGTASNGAVSTGAILALKITQQAGAFSIQPGWVSEDVSSPLTPLVVNGVVFGVSTGAGGAAKLVALNGTNGKTLWQSGSAIASAVSGRSFWAGSGHVFVGTTNGTVYAFGFDMERGSPAKRNGN